MTKYILALKEKEKTLVNWKKPQFLSGTGVSFYTLNVNPKKIKKQKTLMLIGMEALFYMSLNLL